MELVGAAGERPKALGASDSLIPCMKLDWLSPCRKIASAAGMTESPRSSRNQTEVLLPTSDRKGKCLCTLGFRHPGDPQPLVILAKI